MTTINNEEQVNTLPLSKSLQDARLKASLTVDEVAEALNLRPSTIIEIEDKLESVIENKKYPLIYLRGYIANYAKLVKLDKFNEFLEYQQLSAAPDIAINLCPSLDIKPPKKRGKLLFLLLIVIAVVAVGFFSVQKIFFSETNLVAPEAQETILESKKAVTDVSQRLVVEKKS